MAINSLFENTDLFYLSINELFKWLKDNEILKKDFQKEKKVWKIVKESSYFFIDTDLLIIDKDVILLEVEDKAIRENLTKNYQLNEQEVIKENFGEKKNLVLLTKEQWKSINELKINSEEKCLVLFKSDTVIKNKLKKWLENLK